MFPIIHHHINTVGGYVKQLIPAESGRYRTFVIIKITTNEVFVKLKCPFIAVVSLPKVFIKNLIKVA